MLDMTNRLRELREVRGLSQSALADKIGVHWQTVLRWEKDPLGPPRQRLAELAAALNCAQDAFAKNTNGPSMRLIPVTTQVEAGRWAISTERDKSDWYDVAMPDDAGLRGAPLAAAEVHGPSMNKRYPDGAVIVFADIQQTGERLEPGRRYVVERIRADGLREATAKKLWRAEDESLWLVPESNDPRFREPIPLSGSEGEKIRIIGRIVMGVIRENDQSAE